MCPKCGTLFRRPGERKCEACGHVSFGRLTLRHPATGRSITANLDTDIGQKLLHDVAGEDARYASSPQCTVYRDATLASWAIRTSPMATNPTCLNGTTLGADPMMLKDGDVISIGTTALHLVAHIDD